MPTDFDFDPSNSDLQIGLEVEYPGMNPGDEKFVSRGRDTSGLENDIGRIPHGFSTYDGTVGLEIVSDVLDLEDAPQWYADVIELVTEDYGTYHQPVGLMERGSTAGLHVHLSELSEEQARRLYEISTQPWAHVMFCSSIAASDDAVTWPVFRGGRHCRMNYDSGRRYDCINRRASGHYEWRLPEPMIPEHLDVLVKFLRIFEVDPDEAIRYAQERLDEGDDRITSIRRAEAVGIEIDGVPSVNRSTAPEDPDGFYEMVEDRHWLPEIYHVEYDGEHYYLMESQLVGEFDVGGYTFRPDDVLYADSLNPVGDGLHDEIRSAFRRRGEQVERETEATQELKEIIKKKKGK